MRETRTKDHHHKNQLRDGWVLGGRATQPNMTTTLACYWRNHSKHLFAFATDDVSLFWLSRCEMSRRNILFHYADEIECIKNFTSFWVCFLLFLLHPLSLWRYKFMHRDRTGAPQSTIPGTPLEKPILIFHHKFTSLTSPIHTVLRDFFLCTFIHWWLREFYKLTRLKLIDSVNQSFFVERQFSTHSDLLSGIRKCLRLTHGSSLCSLLLFLRPRFENRVKLFTDSDYNCLRPRTSHPLACGITSWMFDAFSWSAGFPCNNVSRRTPDLLTDVAGDFHRVGALRPSSSCANIFRFERKASASSTWKFIRFSLTFITIVFCFPFLLLCVVWTFSVDIFCFP